jgi:16S rRNA (uracil1498-N3)-methyltransferase
MPHFFVDPSNIKGDRFSVEGRDFHYLINVRRFKAGDAISIFDGTGSVFSVVIDTIGEDALEGRVLARENPGPSGPRLRLLTAVPKGDRFDWLVEKTAELGVAEIVPLITERSVIKDVSENKLERWERLSKAASQQSGRPDIMPIAVPMKLKDAFAMQKDSGISVIPWESESSVSLQAVLNSVSAGRDKFLINVFIGPEGGFSHKEIELASSFGIKPVTLGKRILRVETAGLAASILALSCFGEYK